MIEVGTQVRYYQPGIDGILSSWAGEPIRVYDDRGEIKTATVSKVTVEEGITYYDTEEGVFLRDSDLRMES